MIDECVVLCWVQVDDKYQYSIENQDNNVHGWISLGSDAPVGFWMISPSNEFRNAGPIKQDLTSHVGPFTLSVSPALSPHLCCLDPSKHKFLPFQLYIIGIDRNKIVQYLISFNFN